MEKKDWNREARWKWRGAKESKSGGGRMLFFQINKYKFYLQTLIRKAHQRRRSEREWMDGKLFIMFSCLPLLFHIFHTRRASHHPAFLPHPHAHSSGEIGAKISYMKLFPIYFLFVLGFLPYFHIFPENFEFTLLRRKKIREADEKTFAVSWNFSALLLVSCSNLRESEAHKDDGKGKDVELGRNLLKLK